MTHLCIASIVLVLMVTGFRFVYCVSSVESAYLGLYKGLVERAVVVATQSGIYALKPMIYLPKLRADLQDYFEERLAPYCQEYSFSLSNILPVSAVSLKNYSYGVSISFLAEIDDIHVKQKTAEFYIRRNT